MSGIPGAGGPVPKRSEARRRRNKVSLDHVTAPGVVEIPPTPVDLHPTARDWFESLKTSGQSQFYESSDWYQAIYIAEAMTKNLNASRFSAQLFAAVLAGMSELLTTEGSRRRARMEIERLKKDETAPPGVSKMADFRKKLAQ